MTTLTSTKGLQQTYAPHSTCFGCGPSNDKGLKINSVVSSGGDEGAPIEVTAHWTPAAHHEAFPGMVNGGIIGALLDCHSNWTAAYALMKERGETTPPCTVTAHFNVKLLRPTPSDSVLELKAKPTRLEGDRAYIFAELSAGGKVTATCEGLFVAVKPGHPAYHRW